MGQPVQGGAGILQVILPFLVILAIFYFLLILPNSRKEKQRREMLDNLKKGDKVITIGGLVGTVDEIKGKVIILKVDENTRVDFVRQAISQIFVPEK